MKIHIKTFAFAAVASFVFLACDDTSNNNNNNNTEQEYKPDYPFISRDKIPAMDSRVVSYKWDHGNKLGYYGNACIVTDKDTLKLLFPNIFNDKKNKSQCNYFALYFAGSGTTMHRFYPILSEDMILNLIHCNPDEKLVETLDLAYSAMLVCDDKKGTLRESIDLDSTRNYIVPDWDCQSGKGGPNWEEVYY